MTTGLDIHAAAQAGDDTAVRRLLDAGTPVDVREDWGNTPLLAAVHGGHLSTVRLLLERGANPLLDDQGDHGTTDPARAALKARRLDLLGVVLEAIAGITDPTFARVSYLSALLFQPIHARYQEGIAALLAAGADIDVVFDYDRRTPLMSAMGENDLDMMRFLLGRGARIDMQSPNGTTTLMLAVLCRNATAARVLLAAGARSDLRDEEGRTALDLARLLPPAPDLDAVIQLLTGPSDPR
jgi:ankyrin repeat protein